jgi:hypothetical protein
MKSRKLVENTFQTCKVVNSASGLDIFLSNLTLQISAPVYYVTTTAREYKWHKD